MHSKRSLAVAGILTLLIGMFAMFPARVAVHWFLPDGIAVNGIDGTAWSGDAKAASANGIYLRDLQWRIRPLSLLTGKVSYRLSAKPLSGFAESIVNVGVGGKVSMTEVSASLPLSLFADGVGVKGLAGTASIQFNRLEIVDGLATAADGTVQVANLVVPVVSSSSLGGYKAEFFTQNNGVGASIEDTDGVIDLAGSLQIRADRSFEFIGQVVAKPTAPDGVKKQLRFLPPPNDRGQQEIRLEGIL